MHKKIKYYPKSYQMSDELTAFFSVITKNEALQAELYATGKLSEVAMIAKKLGFDIKLLKYCKRKLDECWQL